MRRETESTLLEVRAEALCWEREGLPGGARGRTYSLPSAYGIQYGVQGVPRPSWSSCSDQNNSEMNEIKQLLKQQQEQLTHLTQSLALMQGHTQPRRPYHAQQLVICRRCHRPGHYARECEGERIYPHSQSLAPADRAFRGGPQPSSTLPEN